MIGKSCSSLFTSASRSIWWSVGCSGVLSLLEIGVARNEGGGDTGERGNGTGSPPCAWSRCFTSFLWAKGAGYSRPFGVRRCFAEDKCAHRIPVPLL